MLGLRVVGLAGAIAVVLSCAPGAQARLVDPGPVAYASDLPAEIEGTVGEGGTLTASSPPLSPTAKTIAVDVVPETSDDERYFNKLSAIIAGASSLKNRVLLCIGLASDIFADGESSQSSVDISSAPYGVEILFLSLCLNMAVQLSRPKEVTTASSAAAQCPQAARQIKAKFKAVGGGRYTGTVKGKTRKAPKKLALRTTCVRKGKGFSMRFRPRAKGKSLRSVVGDRLSVGLYNPAGSGGSAAVKLTFRK